MAGLGHFKGFQKGREVFGDEKRRKEGQERKERNPRCILLPFYTRFPPWMRPSFDLSPWPHTYSLTHLLYK